MKSKKTVITLISVISAGVASVLAVLGAIFYNKGRIHNYAVVSVRDY